MYLHKIFSFLAIATMISSCMIEVDPKPSPAYTYEYSDYYYEYEICYEPYWHDPYYCYSTLVNTYCVWYVNYGYYSCDEEWLMDEYTGCAEYIIDENCYY